MLLRHTLLWGLCSVALTACSPASDNSESPDSETSSHYEHPYESLSDDAPQRDDEQENDAQREHAASSEDVDCQLTIGFDIWEPYQFIDVGEQVRGLDVEIARATAGLMQCDIEFQQATWVDLLHYMQTGEIDMLMGASKTSERENYAFFSDAYREEQFVLFVRDEDQRQFSDMSLTDVLQENKRIGIVDSYHYGDEFQTYYDEHSDENSENGAQFMSAMMGEFNLVRLLDRDIDGFLEDRVVGHSLIRRKGLSDYISPAEVELPASTVYVMFSRESTDEALVAAFNEALEALRYNGEYDAIIERYVQ